MFTGIVEQVGRVVALERTADNLDIRVEAPMAPELVIDQSVAHNGVCLTVVELSATYFRVTAVRETLERSNLGQLVLGAELNLERCLRLGDRLDGHMVQGHVDTTTECIAVAEEGGSWRFTFRMPTERELLVAKGSICINGVSLTIADLNDEQFSVAIIPYTFAHTTFRGLRPGHAVNVEFDVLGKYVQRMLQR